MAAYVIVFLATVLYSGAVALNAVFDVSGVFQGRFGMQPADAELLVIGPSRAKCPVSYSWR